MRTRRTNERPVNPEARSTFDARNGTRENDSARPRPFTLVNDIECGPHYRHYQWRTPLSCQSFGVDNRERAITHNGGHSAAVLIAIAASSTEPVADRLISLRFRRPPPAVNHRGRRRGFRRTTFHLRT